MFKHDDVSTGTQPIALGLNGTLDVIVASYSGVTQKFEIDPMKDFEFVHNYIEYIFNRLNETKGT